MLMMQTTSHILMIRPVNFCFNAETAVNNAFQIAGDNKDVQQKAAYEFDTFVRILQNEGVDVTVIDDTPVPHTPDSIFPNNWISFHNDGNIFLYPMFAANRRLERKPGVLKQMEEQFSVKKIVDLSSLEEKELFLEGTGSMVLDRQNRIAYACLSPRTHAEALDSWCKESGYKPVVFHAVDTNGKEIYHTNVMMCVADKYAVVCLDSIKDAEEKAAFSDAIESTGKELIAISYEQMNHFAGNMLQVHNDDGEKLLIMSTQAYASLNRSQIKRLNKWNRIVHAPLNTIESNGGGSARCMMAEVHLPIRS